MALAHHGHHRLKHSVDRFEAQKTGSKELRRLDEFQALDQPKQSLG